MMQVAMQGMGSAIKGFVLQGGDLVAGLPTTLISQRLVLLAVWIPKAVTITGVRFVLSVSGTYTASNYNGVGLYSHSSGTLSLVASAATDGNLWKGFTGTVLSKAFTGTYSAAAGLFYIGAIYSASSGTAPNIFSSTKSGIGTQTIFSSFDFTNSNKTSGTLASQTTMPATVAMSSTTNTQYRPMLYLY